MANWTCWKLLNFQINLEERKTLLSQDRESNALYEIDKCGCSVLHYAVGNPLVETEIVRLLLNSGVDPNVRNEYGCSVLHCALQNPNVKLEILELLLNEGAEPNVGDNNNNTPLHVAIDNCNVSLEMVKLMVTRGADPGAKNKYGCSVLHNAVGNLMVETEIVRLLLNSGVDPNVRNEYGCSVLHCALQNPNVKLEILELLLNGGAEPNVGDNNNNTPLHVAVDNCNVSLEMVKLLVNKGADTGANNIFQCTPLHFLLVNKHVKFEIVKFLLNNKAPIHVPDNRDHNPIDCAVICRQFTKLSVIDLLLNRGATMGIRSQLEHFSDSFIDIKIKFRLLKPTWFLVHNSILPLLKAAQNSKVRLKEIEYFLDKGGNINSRDQYGFSLLHTVILNSNSNLLDVVRLLLKKGASINEKNAFGCTPLHYAVQICNASPEIVQLLLENGSSADIGDMHGDIPLDYAIEDHIDLGIIQLLLSTKISFRNSFIKTMNKCSFINEFYFIALIKLMLKYITFQQVSSNRSEQMNCYNVLGSLYFPVIYSHNLGEIFLDYVYKCICELHCMKHDFLSTLSLFDLVMCDINLSVAEMLIIWFDDKYPIYMDIIESKVKREDLIKSIKICTSSVNNQEKKILVMHDELCMISHYLSRSDLCSLKKAFYFPLKSGKLYKKQKLV